MERFGVSARPLDGHNRAVRLVFSCHLRYLVSLACSVYIGQKSKVHSNYCSDQKAAQCCSVQRKGRKPLPSAQQYKGRKGER